MSWLLFMDESGHDHKTTPFEVRGGVAIHTCHIWSFIQDWNKNIQNIFGSHFAELKGEIKGSTLLERKKFQWANVMQTLPDPVRRRCVSRFLTRNLQKKPPEKRDFTAFGQASLLMARRIFDLLQQYEAVLFASLIPCGVKKPCNFQFDHYLRKDHVFLQERFFYFLEERQEHGLLVMDQTEKKNDKRFVGRLQDYYTKTQPGAERARWVVPSPLFVDSEMAPGIQAADLCLYCINWGFRRPEWAFTGQTRDEIQDQFGGRVGTLQFRGTAHRDDATFPTYGIIYVPDPYQGRQVQ